MVRIVVSLSFSPSCVTRKKTARKKKMSRELLEARSMRKEGLPPKEQTIRKVMEEGTVRKIQKKNHTREGSWKKKSCKEEVKKTNSCRVNSTVGLTNWTRLKGALAATFSAVFWVLVEFPFARFSLQLENRTCFPFQVDIFYLAQEPNRVLKCPRHKNKNFEIMGYDVIFL